MFNLD